MKRICGILLTAALLMNLGAPVFAAVPEVKETLKKAAPKTTQAEPAKEASSAPEPAKTEEAPDWKLLLVNYENGIAEEFTPELEEVQNGYRMDARVAGAARQMIIDARAQGIELLVCSAYRPYSSQLRNFNNSVNNYMAYGLTREQAAAETMKLIAEPGKSEHQTGLAADIVTPAYQSLVADFENTAAAKWLAKNAPAYGFILRFPKDKTEITKISYEPWHFRYVGVDAAKEITEKGLCLEEYLAR